MLIEAKTEDLERLAKFLNIDLEQFNNMSKIFRHVSIAMAINNFQKSDF